MPTKEKLINRLLSKPKDFTYEETKRLFLSLGFNEYNSGRTSGSAMRFVSETGRSFMLHKPHPQNNLKTYVINDMIEFLKENGYIK